MTMHSKPLHTIDIEKYGNLMMQMDDYFHRYSREEIFNVLKMYDYLYEICPAPRNLSDGGKPCPMNCPFLPWKDLEKDCFTPYGCIMSRILIADFPRIKRWASRQLSTEWKQVERDD